MLPDDLHIVTRVARSGMLVRDVFRECLSARVQSLPYRDEAGRIAGRVTLKHIANRSIVPEYVVQLALVVGDRLSTFEDMERRLPRTGSHLDRDPGRFRRANHGSGVSGLAQRPGCHRENLRGPLGTAPGRKRSQRIKDFGDLRPPRGNRDFRPDARPGSPAPCRATGLRCRGSKHAPRLP